MKKLILFLCLICISSLYSSDFEDGVSMKNGQIATLLNNAGELDTDDIIVEKITVQQVVAKLKDKLSVVHIWGSWCTSTILGLDCIKELIDQKVDAQIILVSVDVCSKQQVEIMKKILAMKKIKIKSYILENDFGKSQQHFEIMKKILAMKKIKIKSYILENDFGKSQQHFAKFYSSDHIYNLIHSFDKSYRRVEVAAGARKMYISPVPYIGIINKEQDILYSKVPDIDPNKKQALKQDEFYVLNTKKIMKIINNNQ